MNIAVVVEGINHALVARQSGGQPNFKLAIVGADQQITFTGHESGPNIATKFSSDWDSLQVGIGAG